MPEPQGTITRLKRPSQPLRNGHSYAHAIVETVREPLLILDSDLCVKLVNRSFYKTFHVSPEETEDRLVYELGDGQWDIPKLREFLEEILPRDGHFQDFEVEHDFPAIGRKAMLLNARRLRQEGTDTELLLLAVEDVTERKRVEEALRRADQELSITNRIAAIFLAVPDEESYGEALEVVLEVLESAHGVLGYIDDDGALVCASMTREVWSQCQVPYKEIVFPPERWRGIWGRALTEKKSLYSNEPGRVPKGHIPIRRSLAVPIIHQDSVIGLFHVGNKAVDYDESDRRRLENIAGYIAPILSARLQRDRQEKERKRVEEELRQHRDRLDVLVNERTAELARANEKLLQEIAEHKLAEEALRESEKRFRVLAASAPIGIFLTDAEGEVSYTNERLWAITGLSPEESPGFRWTSFIHPDDREEMLAARSKALAERREFDREFHVLTPQGETRWVRVHTRPLFAQGDRGAARVGVLEDITERKLAEEEMTALRDALERRVAELDAFAYSVSHDLKEPLRAIEAFGRFVLEDYGDRLDEQGREYLERLAAASIRMQRLIDDLLALSRASRHSRPSRVDVGRLVREVAEWMRPQIDGEGVTVEVEEGLPEVLADSTQVEQIFRNLIGNGLKFNQSGRPLVRVGFKGREGRMGIFYVQDNGIGIEPQYHERIFGMFQRLHRREEYDGTGAGLAIVKRVVEYLDGRIWVGSEVGAGSTFFVALPLWTKGAAPRLREAA